MNRKLTFALLVSGFMVAGCSSSNPPPIQRAGNPNVNPNGNIQGNSTVPPATAPSAPTSPTSGYPTYAECKSSCINAGSNESSSTVSDLPAICKQCAQHVAGV